MRSLCLRHEPIDRLSCAVGIGVEPHFDYFSGNNEKGKIAEMEHHAPSFSSTKTCKHTPRSKHTHTHTNQCCPSVCFLSWRPH